MARTCYSLRPNCFGSTLKILHVLLYEVKTMPLGLLLLAWSRNFVRRGYLHALRPRIAFSQQRVAWPLWQYRR